MRTLSIDLETYSSVNLKAAGAYKYCESEDFEILLLGYSIDYGPVTVIDRADGQQIPQEFLAMLTDKEVLKTAYNAPFERAALSAYLGSPMPPEQWSCTMVLAAQVGLPLGLDAVCAAMGLPQDKAKKDGSALIRYFSKPCAPTLANGGRTRNMPWDDYEKWERYKAYNQRDVEVENTIRKKLLRYLPDETERRFWCLDQKINDRGVRLDLELAQNAILFNERYTQELTKEAKEISGLANVNSPVQVKAWLENVEGYEIESLNKKAMPDVLAEIKTEKAKRFLELRTELSKTSTSKFDKMRVCACKDEHARGLFQFYGASRTGRFAGRLLQLQNLPQNHLKDLKETRALVRAGSYDELRKIHPNVTSTLSELIRTAIIPEPECKFIVVDFSAIEARVIAWIAGEEDDLAEFRGAGKIYEATAARMFHVPRETIVEGHENYALRAKGKVAVLACGYQGGSGALIAMGALNAGIPEEELPRLVSQWREAHPNITAWWASLESAAKRCIRSKQSTLDIQGGIIFEYERGNMFMRLPSGRRIAYVNASIGTNRFGRESIVYAGSNQVTRKWEMLETYGGKLAENCVQATARDCLRTSMLRLDEAGYDIRAHVHDEIILNEPKASGRGLEDVLAILRTPPEWGQDLPLNAAGFETDYYMKD